MLGHAARIRAGACDRQAASAGTGNWSLLELGPPPFGNRNLSVGRRLHHREADAEAAMCQSCVDIDEKIALFRQVLRSTKDAAEIDRLNRLIADLYADRERLHRNEEQ